MRFLWPVLFVATALFWAVACDAPKEKSNNAATAESGAHPALKPLPAASQEQLPERVVTLLESINLIGRPMLEHCDLMGEDLNVYLDMYKSEFEAAAKIDLTDAQRNAVLEAYNKAATVTVRCLEKAEGRRANVRLKNLAQPLLPKKS